MTSIEENNMTLSITTPALLFPAISLLLLAYTNRFLVLAQLVRTLHKDHRADPQKVTTLQIDNLRLRLRLIRQMQLFGILAFLFCTLAMFSLFLQQTLVGELIFGMALLLLLISLGLSLWEISISTRALRYELSDIADARGKQ